MLEMWLRVIFLMRRKKLELSRGKDFSIYLGYFRIKIDSRGGIGDQVSAPYFDYDKKLRHDIRGPEKKNLNKLDSLMSLNSQHLKPAVSSSY